jgi:hypothetical protein
MSIIILNAAYLLDPSTMPPRKEPPPLLDPNPPPPDDAERILALIERRNWRKARATNRWGKPQTPHEYTVRAGGHGPDAVYDDAEAEAVFAELFALIQQHGRAEKYGRDTRLYCYPGDDRKYWSMTPNLGENGNINRMWIADDLERLRKTGQIE